MLRSPALLALVAFPLAAQELPLVPWPKQVQRGDGFLTLASDLRVHCAAKELVPLADALSSTLRRTTGIDARRDDHGLVHLALDPDKATDAYRLEVADEVRIDGGSPRAVAFGAATLIQLAARDGDLVTIPRVVIVDAPSLEFRGVMLDVARFWHEASLLREVVDLCWLAKLDVLHLHLSDDQSFTFPSRELPRLASTSADGQRRHFTRDELEGLVAYATARGIAIVPEIDVPGHSSVMARAYPELFGRGLHGMNEPAALDALDRLVGELCDVFRSSPYIHFGADEVGGDREEYCRFVARMTGIVRAHGRRPIAWEGFPGTGTASTPIPTDLVVMAWSLDTNPPDRLLAAGHDVINCGWWPLYIVPTQNRAPTARDIHAWHPRRFENLGSQEPVTVFAPTAPLLGAQLCMWEQTPDVVIPLLRSRVPAFAERTWSPDERRDYDDYVRRATALERRIAPLFTVPQVAEVVSPIYRYRFYAAPPRAAWDAMPDLASLAPTSEGTLGAATPERVRAIRAAQFVGVEAFGHIDTKLPDGWNPFALELRGRMRVDTAGTHEFLLRANDGLADLQIDGVRVAWRATPGSDRFDVTRGVLASGVHEFTLRYLCRDIRNELNLRVRLPGAEEAVAFESLVLPLSAPSVATAETPRAFTSTRTLPLPSLTTGCSVRVSGGTEGAMLPMLAVDGDPDNASGWHAHPWPQWLEVDLGGEHPIDRVRVTTYHDGARSYRFRVEASRDREHWTTVADHGANHVVSTADGIEDRFAPTPARWLRIHLLANTANMGVHLSEFSAWADGVKPRYQDGGKEIVVRESQREVTFDSVTVASALRFSGDLTAAGRVTGPGLELTPGARIVYEHTDRVSIQTVAAPLELRGDATFVNDNAWTHDAHMLRIAAALHGAGTLHIDGAGDGGVELSADSRGSFTGAMQIDGGMLIPRVTGALGSGDSPLSMRGGKLFLPGVDLDHALRIDGDATLWLGGPATLRGDVDLAWGALTIDTGGGNACALLGALRGAGRLVFRAAGRSAAPVLLGGTRANDASAPLSLAGGTLALAKPAGVAAIAGDLILGGDAVARIELRADEQVSDTAHLSIVGKGAEIVCTGHKETLGTLDLRGDLEVVCGAGHDEVRFAAMTTGADSPQAQLIVRDFDPKADRVTLGEDAPLSRVGFRDPRGFPIGTYHATRATDGSLCVDAPVAPSRTIAFPIDAASDAGRAKLWEGDGLAELCAAGTPLRAGDVISVFGDSITWLHGFVGRIETALARGAGTKALGVTVRNRGINGGGVRELKDGSANAARARGLPGGAGNDPQAPFAEVLAEDHPRVVVILIGINDVNWRGTSESQFEDALRMLCQQARSVDAHVVLATLMLTGELPDGSNPNDARIDRYADITRGIAREQSAVLVDLREIVIGWLRNHNRELRLDGTLQFRRTGLLTYDGIHLSDQGNDLVARALARGVAAALASRSGR